MLNFEYISVFQVYLSASCQFMMQLQQQDDNLPNDSYSQTHQNQGNPLLFLLRNRHYYRSMRDLWITGPQSNGSLPNSFPAFTHYETNYMGSIASASSPGRHRHPNPADFASMVMDQNLLEYFSLETQQLHSQQPITESDQAQRIISQSYQNIIFIKGLLTLRILFSTIYHYTILLFSRIDRSLIKTLGFCYSNVYCMLVIEAHCRQTLLICSTLFQFQAVIVNNEVRTLNHPIYYGSTYNVQARLFRSENTKSKKATPGVHRSQSSTTNRGSFSSPATSY